MRLTSDDALDLSSVDADASGLRFTVEGTRAQTLDSGAVLSPRFQVGLRHDGGDAETGTGLELGGGLRYASTARLALEVNARALLAQVYQYFSRVHSGSKGYGRRRAVRALQSARRQVCRPFQTTVFCVPGVGIDAERVVDSLLGGFGGGGGAHMQRAPVGAPEGGGDALLAGEDVAQGGPAGALADRGVDRREAAAGSGARSSICVAPDTTVPVATTPTGGFGLAGPSGSERVEHVDTRDGIDLDVAETR